MITGWEGR